MKILIIPDSFKGSLTSIEVCSAIMTGLENAYQNNEIECIPCSDGGEGFCDCLGNILNANKVITSCHDIYNIPKGCYYYTTNDTAIIESASASGLQKRRNIMQASSSGTGELIKDAYNNGYTNIILGLGGTGCCDAGIGALNQLGITFYDELFNPIKNPKAIDLNNIFGISYKNKLQNLNITFACDVENEYFGKNGASYVFAPQKGARRTDVEDLDEGFKRVNAFFKNDISKVKGAGAGGGICGGLYSVFGGTIKSGFEILCEYSHLEDKIKNCDIVITGEGKTDKQTLMGKLPFKVCSIAKKYNKRVIVISGIIEDGTTLGDKMISLVDDNISPEQAIDNAAQILIQKSAQIL